MSEVEAKSMTLNIGKRCQHAEPLLSFPYVPADHPSDQIYYPNSEEEWEKNLEVKLQNCVASRQEATDCCFRSAAAIRKNLSDTADAWFKTSKALQESIQEDERTVYNIQCHLKRLDEEISSTKQRLASFYDVLKIQDRVKNAQLWRLQTMTYRPGPDHIRDAPVQKLEEELRNIETKKSYVSDNVERNKDLLQNLSDEKMQQMLELEKVSRKLFIERENCLGARRTIHIEGVNLNDYVTS
ncbi:hypothetical protein X975_19546, partial [Stegodyphus mimosarum]